MLDIQMDDSYKVDESFKKPNELITIAQETIKNDLQDILNYKKVSMNYGNDIYIRLDKVCESGVVYVIVCPVDAGSNKYNTATEAVLIVKDDGTVKFILSSIDAKVNKLPKEISIWTDINQAKIGKEIDLLGSEIKPESAQNIGGVFRKKKEELINQKNELVKQKQKILVSHSIEILSDALLEHNKKL